ncbi:alpha-IPM isomerase [Pandoraea iniqua]|uniref:LeuD/DmdB family oxidoreductase small subunit n=1 Tax=Pandoraea iniqua TaxID=2508288 RepID=UPI0012401C74|nr:alpha-IPM isomerase [Pandoraea iniqua]VVE27644.1 alpha-IPM isomerase [Pandoraea iniqua]
MNAQTIEGRARCFGDDVNTDYIISSRRKRDSLDPQVLRQYLFETTHPDFAQSVRVGDLIVAGKNFGCGSAMEVAVTAVVGAGVRVVLAQTFARTYFRNAINNGLYPVECDTSRIGEGDMVRVVFGEQTQVWINDETTPLHGAPIAPEILQILNAGGLVPYLREHRTL